MEATSFRQSCYELFSDATSGTRHQDNPLTRTFLYHCRRFNFNLHPWQQQSATKQCVGRLRGHERLGKDLFVCITKLLKVFLHIGCDHASYNHILKAAPTRLTDCIVDHTEDCIDLGSRRDALHVHNRNALPMEFPSTPSAPM